MEARSCIGGMGFVRARGESEYRLWIQANGAEERTRTSTPLRAPAPKAGVSAISPLRQAPNESYCMRPWQGPSGSNTLHGTRIDPRMAEIDCPVQIQLAPDVLALQLVGFPTVTAPADREQSFGAPPDHPYDRASS